MLPKENNELICRVGAGTAMGTAFRRFWLPALLSQELPGPDCDPRRVQLLGEDFIAFRDSDGKVGLLDEYCPHRNASLGLGRVEGGGIRCIYHGWKFAVDGTVLETPNVADPAFKQRFKAKSYPVREAGGLDLGLSRTAGAVPAFPNWPFFSLPSAHLLPVYAVVNCNYVQIMEGLVDSSHLTTLHTSPLRTTGGSELDFAKKTAHMQFNAAPRIEAEETDFGFHYVAMRPISDNPGDGVMARIASFVPPCFVLNPNGDLFFARRAGKRYPDAVHSCLVGRRQEDRRGAAAQPAARVRRPRPGCARCLWPQPRHLRFAACRQPGEQFPAGPRRPAARPLHGIAELHPGGRGGQHVRRRDPRPVARKSCASPMSRCPGSIARS